MTACGEATSPMNTFQVSLRGFAVNVCEGCYDQHGAPYGIMRRTK